MALLHILLFFAIPAGLGFVWSHRHDLTGAQPVRNFMRRWRRLPEIKDRYRGRIPVEDTEAYKALVYGVGYSDDVKYRNRKEAS